LMEKVVKVLEACSTNFPLVVTGKTRVSRL
jgi:hypothetical protein